MELRHNDGAYLELAETGYSSPDMRHYDAHSERSIRIAHRRKRFDKNGRGFQRWGGG